MDSNLVENKAKVAIAIVSASCCMPGLTPFEEKARKNVEQAVSETGVEAVIRTLPISSYYSSLPRDIVTKWMADYGQGKISAPAILIDGAITFYGVPETGAVKEALLKVISAKKQNGGVGSES